MNLTKRNIKVQMCTDKGMVRSNNEDYCGYYIPEEEIIKNRLGSLFAVADGVGGSRAGEVASSEAVNVLLQEYYFGGAAVWPGAAPPLSLVSRSCSARAAFPAPESG